MRENQIEIARRVGRASLINCSQNQMHFTAIIHVIFKHFQDFDWKKKLEKEIGPQIFFKSFENAKRDLDI